MIGRRGRQPKALEQLSGGLPEDHGDLGSPIRQALATTDGDLELTAPYTFTIGDLTTNPGFVSGEFSGDGVRGTFKVTPLEGDCVTSPITRVRVHADFFFADSFFTR